MDGQLKMLASDDLSEIKSFVIREMLPTVVHAGVKQLAISQDCRKVLIGAVGGDIAEVFVNLGR